MYWTLGGYAFRMVCGPMGRVSPRKWAAHVWQYDTHPKLNAKMGKQIFWLVVSNMFGFPFHIWDVILPFIYLTWSYTTLCIYIYIYGYHIYILYLHIVYIYIYIHTIAFPAASSPASRTRQSCRAGCNVERSGHRLRRSDWTWCRWCRWQRPWWSWGKRRTDVGWWWNIWRVIPYMVVISLVDRCLLYLFSIHTIHMEVSEVMGVPQIIQSWMAMTWYGNTWLRTPHFRKSTNWAKRLFL